MNSNYRYFKLGLSLLWFTLGSCTKQQPQEHDKSQPQDSIARVLYTCPMPEDSVFSHNPGNCPKCGMELVPVQANEDIDTLAQLVQPSNRFVVSKLLPIVPSKDKAQQRIGVEGYLTYNANNASSISTRVSGRVEKLYVKYNFQSVRKGEKLLELYSPDLLTAQQEWLYLQKSTDATDQSAKATLEAKLLNLGMQKVGIDRMHKTGMADPFVAIYANTNGHVHFLNGNTDISEHAFGLNSNTANMGTSAMGTEDPQALREGDYVKKGDLLFTIADQKSIWALFKVLPADIAAIKKGAPVEVSVGGSIHEGQVDFIEKSFEDFFTVRVVLQCNDHEQFKIGSLVKGYINVGQKDKTKLWVPRAAVVQLGKSSSAVFVKKPLGYEAREVRTGAQAGDWTEVTAGLTQADSIAPTAAYFIDSEAFVLTK